MSATPHSPGRPNPARARWLKLMHEWHWVSAAISLVTMLLFTITGVTLNHASDIPASPQVTQRQATLPLALAQALREAEPADGANTPVPEALQAWVRTHWDVRLDGREAEWPGGELYVSLPRPGGDAWLRVALDSAQAEYERTDRGWIAYFNDLHKGRHTGAAWRWFIDIFALACAIFTITGLVILYLHAASRAMTWPITSLGLLIPALLALLWMH